MDESKPNERMLPIPEDLSLERTYWWLMSQMLYPDSAQWALGAFVTDLVFNELKDRDSEFIVDIPLGWVRSLAELPSFDERALIEKRTWKDGMTVGTVLSLVYAMARERIPEPSLNKAMEILDSCDFGVPVHRGTKEIRKALKRMAPVAHLWAANAMLCYTDRSPDVVPGRDGLNLFISWATTIRVFGIAHKTVHGRASPALLDPAVCLTFPPRFCPAGDDEISLPLPEWIKTKLAAYKAPMRL